MTKIYEEKFAKALFHNLDNAELQHHILVRKNFDDMVQETNKLTRKNK